MRERKRDVSTSPASLGSNQPPTPGASGDALPQQGVPVTNKKEHEALLAEVEKLLSDADTAIKDRVALRDAVCAYFAAERERGESLDSIVTSVEDMLDRAEARASGRINGHDGQRELAQQLIDWCIELDRAGKLKS